MNKNTIPPQPGDRPKTGFKESFKESTIRDGMDGTWVNQKTGHMFTVADCFESEDQVFIKTTAGEFLDWNITKDYIRMSDDEVQAMAQERSPKKDDEIPPEVLAEINGTVIPELMLDEDMDLLKGNPQKGVMTWTSTDEKGNTTLERKDFDLPPVPEHTSGYLVPTCNVDLNSIDIQCAKKALDDKPIPHINIEAAWEDVPSQAIEMLLKVMNISEESLIDYYVYKLYNEIDFAVVMERLKEVVKDAIMSIKEDGSPTFLNAYRTYEPQSPEEKPVSAPRKNTRNTRAKKNGVSK